MFDIRHYDDDDESRDWFKPGVSKTPEIRFDNLTQAARCLKAAQLTSIVNPKVYRLSMVEVNVDKLLEEQAVLDQIIRDLKETLTKEQVEFVKSVL